MRVPKNYIPKMTHHRPSGQARVRLSEVDIYLGPWGTPEAASAYDDEIAAWIARGRVAPRRTHEPVLIVELCVAFLRWAEGYYRKDGRETTQMHIVRRVCRSLREHSGARPAATFTTIDLEALRQDFVNSGLSRPTVNRYTGVVRQIFRFGAERRMVSASVWHDLKTLRELRQGRTPAPEPLPPMAASDSDVDAALGRLSPEVADIVRVQRLTGMRSSEVLAMTAGAIDTSGAVWVYRPRHKNEHHGHDRVAPIGPRAQAVIAPYTSRRPFGWLWPSPSRPGQHRTPAGYRRAIARACDAAGVPRWHPHQLRHARATEIRQADGIEAAQAVLGHRKISTTEVYSSRMLAVACAAAQKTG